MRKITTLIYFMLIAISLIGQTYTSNPAIGTYICNSTNLSGTCGNNLGGTVKVKVSSITGTSVAFRMQKCNNTSLTSSGTFYLKEGTICGTIVAQGTYASGATYKDLTISPSISAGSSKTYYGLVVSSTGDRFWSGTFTITNPAPAPSITINPSSKSVGSGAGSFTVSVSANVSWSVTSNAPWMYVSPSGLSGSGTVTVTYQANPNTTSRQGTVNFYGSGVTKTLTVSQSGAAVSYYLTVSPATLNFTNASGGQNCTVTTNLSTFGVSDNQTWITTSVTGNVITISCTANTDAARSGTVTVSGSGVSSQYVTVNQAGVSQSSLTCGTQTGTYLGVPAYSCYNCPGGIYNSSGSVTTGLKWQCVEYVNRFYFLIYGMNLKSSAIYGDAKDYYDKAINAGLLRFSNGGSSIPQPGDIICSNGPTSSGHVAIVRQVDLAAGKVYVIQQNYNNNSSDENYALTLTVSNGQYTLTGFGNQIEGWLRKNNNDNPCQATTLTVSNYEFYAAGSNTGATNTTSPPAPSTCLYWGQDVWFKAVVPSSGVLTIRTIAGTLTDAVMSVYAGSCNNLVGIYCEDDNNNCSGCNNSYMPVITISGYPGGTTIYIRVWGFNGATGTFGICALNYNTVNIAAPDDLESSFITLNTKEQVSNNEELAQQRKAWSVSPNPAGNNAAIYFPEYDGAEVPVDLTILTIGGVPVCSYKNLNASSYIGFEIPKVVNGYYLIRVKRGNEVQTLPLVIVN